VQVNKYILDKLADLVAVQDEQPSRILNLRKNRTDNPETTPTMHDTPMSLQANHWQNWAQWRHHCQF
jgi:hypothetical protein